MKLSGFAVVCQTHVWAIGGIVYQHKLLLSSPTQSELWEELQITVPGGWGGGISGCFSQKALQGWPADQPGGWRKKIKHKEKWIQPTGIKVINTLKKRELRNTQPMRLAVPSTSTPSRRWNKVTIFRGYRLKNRPKRKKNQPPKTPKNLNT